MKKGFTLIELLAVIVVIGVIAVIAIPSYNNAIEKQKSRTFIESEKSLLRGLTNYLNFNEKMYPKNIGDIEIVSIKTLQDLKFINEIKNPATGNDCSGYVVIIKNIFDRYTFNPRYRCDGSNLESPVDDNLILDYPFTDYQEPTINLINNQLLPYTNYYTCSKADDDHNCFRHSTSSSPTLALHNSNVTSNLITGDIYTVSGYLYKNGLAYKTTVPNISTYHTSTINKNAKDDGYFEYTQTFNTSQWVFHSNIASAIIDDNLTLRKVQVEKKSYATPYTVGTREGIVRDYSNNNRISTLTLQTTPRWTADKGGSYYFDGTNKYIRTDGNTLLSSSQSYSLWIRPASVSGLRGLLTMHNHGQTSNLGINLNGNKISVSIGYTDATREYNLKQTNYTVKASEWIHVAMVYNQPSNNIKFYINGSLDSTHAIAKPIKFTSDKILLGQWSNSYIGNYIYNGDLSLAKVYDKVLSDNEIKELYDIEVLK